MDIAFEFLIMLSCDSSKTECDKLKFQNFFKFVIKPPKRCDLIHQALILHASLPHFLLPFHDLICQPVCRFHHFFRFRWLHFYRHGIVCCPTGLVL